LLSQSRQKADLEWCINSPGLISGDDSSIIWPDDNWFKSIRVSEQITHFPQPRHSHHFRLGKHFEALLICWLQQDDKFSLIEANRQVFEKKRTVGEFDLLLSHLGQIEHWEVAIKFYLGLPDTRKANHWHGPNTTDRLDLKYKHLSNHQLKLTSNPFGKQTLEALKLKVSVVRGIVKGRLFYPWRQYLSGEFEMPDIVNKNHEKGWWIDETDIPNDSFKRVVYLEKQHWLSPITKNDPLVIMDLPQLHKFLQSPQIEQATHVALLDESGNEMSRGFIVKPTWRQRAVQNQT
jgi:hypothetical protein